MINHQELRSITLQENENYHHSTLVSVSWYYYTSALMYSLLRCR